MVSLILYTPFIVGLLSWTINMVLSIFFLNNKKIKPSFAYATIFLGTIQKKMNATYKLKTETNKTGGFISKISLEPDVTSGLDF